MSYNSTIIEKFFKYENYNIHVKELGEGPVIIIIHGWMNSSNRWTNIALPLSKSYKVFLIDLPGFGDSKVNGNLSNNLISSYSDTLGKVINDLTKEPIHTIIAHSLGGLVTYGIMEKQLIKEPKHLIYCSVPFSGINKYGILCRRTKINQFLLKTIIKNKLRFVVKIGSRPTVYKMKYVDDITIDDVLRADPIVAAKLVTEISNFKLNETKQKINSKILLIRGKYDWVATDKNYDLIFEKDSYEYCTLEKTVHMPMCEESSLLEKIISFIEI